MISHAVMVTVNTWTPPQTDAPAAIPTSGASLVRIDDRPDADEWDRFVDPPSSGKLLPSLGLAARVRRRVRSRVCLPGGHSGPPASWAFYRSCCSAAFVFGRFAVSLPFVNYGGSHRGRRDRRTGTRRPSQGGGEQHQLSYIELRHLDARFPELPAKHHKVAMWLSLPKDVDTLWQHLDRKVRNQIRKAEKSDLTVATGGAELVGDFYTVFARNMRDLGTPVYSRRLFERVLTEFPDASRLFVVRLKNEPIAAGGTLTWRRTVENPWASSLREHRSLCPNMLLYWAMLKMAVEGGAARFDFGRSTPNEVRFTSSNSGVPPPLRWHGNTSCWAAARLCPGSALPIPNFA